MACDFCNRIYDDSDVAWVDSNLIAYDKRFKMFDIQLNTADPFDGAILTDVKFYPYCGEKLRFKEG